VPDVTPATAPAAILDQIRERWSKVARVELKPEVVPEPGCQPPWLPDVDHLLKAVEDVLKLHQGITDGDYPESLALCEEDGEFSRCPTVSAITAALAGKEGSDE
jgi:hypothetical protein